MDINLSPVAVSGRRRQTTTTTRTPTTTRIKPSSQPCHSCSDDQHSFTSDDREKSLNSCFTDNDSNPFPSSHAQPQRHHLPQSSSILHHHHEGDDDENNHADRDLDSPDQDYDFNSRFSPPPTDNSYHSENHCQCYENDADDTDSEPDFIGSGVESGGRTRRATTTGQYRQKRRTGGGHRNCTMGEDDELVVTQDTVCIIESEARGGVSSARELNEKTMASKGRLPKTTVSGGGVVGGLSPGSKSYHNICGTAMQPGSNGRSYELAKNGQSANFGTVSGSDVACGKLLDKVCINNSCSAGGCCNKRPSGASMVEAVLGGGVAPVVVNSSSSSSNNRSNRKAGNNNHQHHGGPDGINEFMHGPMGGGAPGAGTGVVPAMQLASYGPQMKWTRNNIAVTMERYEPSTSSSSVSPCHSPNHSRPCNSTVQQPRHLYHFNQAQQQQQPGAHNGGGTFQHDYSYAYYEPGAAMRHANIPGSPVAGPSSHQLTPNSIQALLLKSHGYQAKLKKQAAVMAAAAQGNANLAGSSRHAYTTRYGTQENIYEEIGNEDRMRMMMAASTNGHSMVSLNQSMVEEEFRQVHNRHRRVLGELNLSVEAMIMPVNPPVEAGPSAREGEEAEAVPEGSPAHHVEVKSVRGKRNEFMMKPIRNPHLNLQMSRCPTDALSGGACAGATGDCSQINADMDSGFSGSSSGASYIGSLRYQKSQCCGPSGPSGALMGRGQRAYEDPGLLSFSTRSSSSYGSSKSSHNLQRMIRSAEDPGPSSGIHHHHAAAMALNGMPGTSATLKPMSKNASFWSRKGWKIIPGLTSPGGSKPANVLSG